MHHAALNRPRPHDGDFNHQVVKHARSQTRQHAHLRPAFDLEYAHRVGFANHVVRGAILGRDILHRKRRAAPRGHQRKRAADHAEHAEREDIDLQQTERIEVVLVPLHHAAVCHRGIFDRHQAR